MELSDDVIAYLETGLGEPLALRPGRRLAARVVACAGGRATVAVAGVQLQVASEVPLAPGRTVHLVVRAIEAGRLALVLEREAGEPPPSGLDLHA